MSQDISASIHHYLTNAATSAFLQQPVAIHDHWEGEENLLWRVESSGDDAVVKLFLDAGQARSRRQFEAHQLLSPQGLAPEPLWVDRYPEGLARQLLVYRWVDGDPLAPDDELGLEAAAGALAQLHSVPVENVARFSPHPVNLDFYWRIESSSIQRVQQWLDAGERPLQATYAALATAVQALIEAAPAHWVTAPPTPTHGDLRLEHFRIDRGRARMLDWELFGLGDPALDVARWLQRDEIHLGETRVNQWLDAYIQQTPFTDLRERIRLFRRVLAFHAVTFLLGGLSRQHEQEPDPSVQEALPFLQATLTASLEQAVQLLAIQPPEPEPIEEIVAALVDALQPASGAT